jgi:hypothetical protein
LYFQLKYVFSLSIAYYLFDRFQHLSHRRQSTRRGLGMRMRHSHLAALAVALAAVV